MVLAYPQTDRIPLEVQMYHRAWAVGLSLLVLMSACDQSRTTAVQARSIRMSDPTHFVLTAEQRSRLIPNIDVDALQRFLQIAAQTDEGRLGLLQMFSQGRNQGFEIIGTVGEPTGNSALKALLDEIYAPTWEAMGVDEIARSDSPLPGRELAKARLLAKKRAPSDK
jgi:hypothetical protein